MNESHNAESETDVAGLRIQLEQTEQHFKEAVESLVLSQLEETRLQTVVNELNSKLEECQLQFEAVVREADTRMQQLEEMATGMEGELKEVREENGNLRASHASATETIASLAARERGLQAQSDHLWGQVSDLTTTTLNAESRCTTLEKQLLQCGARLAYTEASSSTIEASLQRERSDLLRRLRDTEAQLEVATATAKSREASRTAEVADLESRLKNLENDNTNLRDELRRESSEAALASERLQNAVEAAAASAREQERRARRRVEDLEKEVHEARERLKESATSAVATIDAAYRDAADTRDRLAAANAATVAVEAKLYSAEAATDEARRQVAVTQGEVAVLKGSLRLSEERVSSAERAAERATAAAAEVAAGRKMCLVQAAEVVARRDVETEYLSWLVHYARTLTSCITIAVRRERRSIATTVAAQVDAAHKRMAEAVKESTSATRAALCESESAARAKLTALHSRGAMRLAASTRVVLMRYVAQLHADVKSATVDAKAMSTMHSESVAAQRAARAARAAAKRSEETIQRMALQSCVHEEALERQRITSDAADTLLDVSRRWWAQLSQMLAVRKDKLEAGGLEGEIERLKASIANLQKGGGRRRRSQRSSRNVPRGSDSELDGGRASGVSKGRAGDGEDYSSRAGSRSRRTRESRCGSSGSGSRRRRQQNTHTARSSSTSSTPSTSTSTAPVSSEDSSRSSATHSTPSRSRSLRATPTTHTGSERRSGLLRQRQAQHTRPLSRSHSADRRATPHAACGDGVNTSRVSVPTGASRARSGGASASFRGEDAGAARQLSSSRPTRQSSSSRPPLLRRGVFHPTPTHSTSTPTSAPLSHPVACEVKTSPGAVPLSRRRRVSSGGVSNSPSPPASLRPRGSPPTPTRLDSLNDTSPPRSGPVTPTSPPFVPAAAPPTWGWHPSAQSVGPSRSEYREDRGDPFLASRSSRSKAYRTDTRTRRTPLQPLSSIDTNTRGPAVVRESGLEDPHPPSRYPHTAHKHTPHAPPALERPFRDCVATTTTRKSASVPASLSSSHVGASAPRSYCAEDVAMAVEVAAALFGQAAADAVSQEAGGAYGVAVHY